MGEGLRLNGTGRGGLSGDDCSLVGNYFGLRRRNFMVRTGVSDIVVDQLVGYYS